MPTTDTDALDREDMRELVAGQDAALDRLMERHAVAIFRFVFRMTGNEDDANDLAQETFVRLYSARERYRPSQRFTTWLYTIAGNLARNHLRWRARHPNVSLDAATTGSQHAPLEVLPSADANPAQVADGRERDQAVQSAIRQLPDDLREAIVLCEWEELSMAEAAAILNTTPKAVESRLYRARQRLRQVLQTWL